MHYRLVILALLLKLTPAFADEDTNKIYVSSKNLRYVHNEFIVFTDNAVYATEVLFTDENGLYVKKDELEKLRITPKDKGHERFFRDLLKTKAPRR